MKLSLSGILASIISFIAAYFIPGIFLGAFYYLGLIQIVLIYRQLGIIPPLIFSYGIAWLITRNHKLSAITIALNLLVIIGTVIPAYFSTTSENIVSVNYKREHLSFPSFFIASAVPLLQGKLVQQLPTKEYEKESISLIPPELPSFTTWTEVPDPYWLPFVLPYRFGVETHNPNKIRNEVMDGNIELTGKLWTSESFDRLTTNSRGNDISLRGKIKSYVSDEMKKLGWSQWIKGLPYKGDITFLVFNVDALKQDKNACIMWIDRYAGIKENQLRILLQLSIASNCESENPYLPGPPFREYIFISDPVDISTL